jgi:adenylate cyclase
MSLRQKTLILIAILLVGLIGVLSVSLSFILLGSFTRLEEEDTERNVLRVREAINEEVNNLNEAVTDWARWTDTYNYVQGKNPAFETTNLGDSTFTDRKLNFFLILNNRAQKIFAKGFDLQKEEYIEIPETLQKQVQQGSLLVNHQEILSQVKGIFLLGEDILMISSQPIVTSENQGPIQGSLIMGRYLNDIKKEELAKRTKLELDIFLLEDKELDDNLKKIKEELEYLSKQKIEGEEIPIITQPLDGELISGYTLIRDINGDPALLLEITLKRDIYQQGKTSLIYLLGSLSVVGIIFCISTLLLLERLVLLRLSNLSSDVKNVGKSSNLALRVNVSGKDELSNLGNVINEMLDIIEEGRKIIAEEQEKAERLLLNILPETIAHKLKQSHDSIAENFDEVTILFADIVGFTPLSSRLKPIQLVNLLNEIFSTFDTLADKLGLEKIKTIGDAYMVASGLPIEREDHAAAMAEMALEMQEALARFRAEKGENVQIRIGINTGVAIAGVIGTKKFIYDLWGDAVNVASRMESSGEAGLIQVTESTYQQIKDKYELDQRGKIKIKGKGEMMTYWLLGRKDSKKMSLSC